MCSGDWSQVLMPAPQALYRLNHHPLLRFRLSSTFSLSRWNEGSLLISWAPAHANNSVESGKCGTLSVLDERRNKQISVSVFPELFAPADVLCVLCRREQRCCLLVKSAVDLKPAAWSPRRPANILGWLLICSTQQLCLPQTG